MLKMSHQLLIGDRKTEPLLQLKTKEDVDHAGLSQPLKLLNLKLPFTEKDYKLSLNNNSLIAQPHTEIKVNFINYFISILNLIF
jgi:hypothetical protein